MKPSITKIVPLIMLAYCALAPQTRATCQNACLSNQSTALGDDALLNNTTGVNNTAVGSQALLNNIDGLNNTAVGSQALLNNVNGYYNTAIGSQALLNNNGTIMNTAIGDAALQNNTSGNLNTATGGAALENNTSGFGNIATGVFALKDNTIGNYNTAVGLHALAANALGSANIALGSDAGLKLRQGSDNIYIGNQGIMRESRRIRIGDPAHQAATFIAGINGVTVAGGVGVMIDTKGQLGTVVSSARFKDNIQPMAASSKTILSLKPVTFHYKKELDPEAIPQFGLVAEDVAKVDPDLVARDEQGKPYTVRYEAVNAMLLNEFLKEHRKVEDQASKIERLEAALEKMSARLDAKGL